MTGADPRYNRERGFHDTKYSDIEAGRTEKYYAVLDVFDRRAFDRLPWLRRFGWFCMIVLREPRPARDVV
jgi:hypothetical protein